MLAAVRYNREAAKFATPELQGDEAFMKAVQEVGDLLPLQQQLGNDVMRVGEGWRQGLEEVSMAQGREGGTLARVEDGDAGVVAR